MAQTKHKKNYSKPKKSYHFSVQKLILSIIMAAVLIVIIVLISAFFFKPENIVKSKISAIASDYYENYFYERLINSETYQEVGNIEKVMEKYQDSGLSPLNLRQLLLYDNQKNADSAPLLKKYCNEENTYVKFYPEPPYSKTSYRAEYTYSCNF